MVYLNEWEIILFENKMECVILIMCSIGIGIVVKIRDLFEKSLFVEV